MAQNFELGQVVVTRNVHGLMEINLQFAQEVARAVWMYKHKRWGATCKADARMNDEALVIGERIVAKYKTCEGDIFIITEWDRSVTTILFPEEY